MNPPDKPNVFLPHGGYRKLRSYKVAEAVYDATVVFCRRFYAQDRRMADQPFGAAPAIRIAGARCRRVRPTNLLHDGVAANPGR